MIGRGGGRETSLDLVQVFLQFFHAGTFTGGQAEQDRFPVHRPGAHLTCLRRRAIGDGAEVGGGEQRCQQDDLHAAGLRPQPHAGIGESHDLLGLVVERDPVTQRQPGRRGHRPRTPVRSDSGVSRSQTSC
ncbi:hypothetical protein CcI49_32915 [Frankia sp. CcI49]|nr:hypothetical protein CcI49_32915 [Frankia sp. CcI49]